MILFLSMSLDNDANTIHDYSSVHIRWWMNIAACSVITALTLLAIAGVILHPPENELLMMAMMIAILSLIYGPLLHVAYLKDMQCKICRSLAGLELGVIHCEDDLVVLREIPRKLARQIINGDYDYLMSDTQFCKYMP